MAQKKTLVVNLFAGPGAGKSTVAAHTFAELKWAGIETELVTEFVKELVWEERRQTLDDQLYIFGKQVHRINRLLGQVDVIVTDSPLLFTTIYSDNPALGMLAHQEHNKHENLNVFVHRTKPYHPKGRLQTEEEAHQLDKKIWNMLMSHCQFIEIPGSKVGVSKLVSAIKTVLGEQHV